MEEEINTRVKLLKNILLSITKNPRRNFLKITLRNKAEASKIIYNQILELLNKGSSINEYQLKLARQIYGDILTLINIRLAAAPSYRFGQIALIILTLLKIYNKVKMANLLETVKIVSTLVPSYDGKPEKLEQFIAAIDACRPLIAADHLATAIQVILSKLEGKARAAVPNDAATLNAICAGLRLRCAQTISPDTIVAKLNATKQSEGLIKYTQEVEKLTLQLERAYIDEHVPLETATRLATSAGIKALANGIVNPETKTILKAGTFNTLEKAIEKAAENEADTSASTSRSASILQISRSPRNSNGRGRGRPYRGNSRGRGNNHGRGSYYRGNGRGNYHSSGNFNYGNGRGNFHGSGNFYGNGRGNFQPSRNVFFMYPENQQFPQQMLVGGQQMQQQPQMYQQQVQQQQSIPQNQQRSQYQIALANLQQRESSI